MGHGGDASFKVAKFRACWKKLGGQHSVSETVPLIVRTIEIEAEFATNLQVTDSRIKVPGEDHNLFGWLS